MKTLNEHLWEHIYKLVGYKEIKIKLTSFIELTKTEWSPEFEKLMRNRLIIGALRYSRLNAKNKPKFDRIECMIRRLNDYKKDGNDEHLVDVANLALLEFEEGCHPNKHFNSIDDGEHTKKKE